MFVANMAEQISGKTWKRCMEPAGSVVTETDGDFSSLDAPRGTAGTKSTYVRKKSHKCNHPNYLQTRADSLRLRPRLFLEMGTDGAAGDRSKEASLPARASVDVLLVPVKSSFYIAQYPVRWTAQSAFTFCPPPWQTCSSRHQLGFSGKHSSQAAITHEDYSLTFPPPSISRYSFIQLIQLGLQWRKCPIFETVANGGFETGTHLIASPAFCH